MASRALLRWKKQIFTSVDLPAWSIRGFSTFENGYVEPNVSRFYGTHPFASDIGRKDEGHSPVVAKEQLLRDSGTGIGRPMNNVVPTLGCGIGTTYVTSLLGARQTSQHRHYSSSFTTVPSDQQQMAIPTAGEAQEQAKVKQDSHFFGGSGAARIQLNLMNSLRPLSPHLPVYKPQLTSTVSIFNRISGVYLTTAVLVFYLLCVKTGFICFTYYSFYQFLFHSSNLIPISLELTALAMAYHLYHGVRHLIKR